VTLATLLLFCAVALVAIVTPGPTVLLALSNGSRYGLRLSCFGMAGAVASDLVLVAAAALGLGALLAASEFWFATVKWLGVGYLAFLGLQMLVSRGLAADPTAVIAGHTAPAAVPPSGHALFRRSFLVSVTNPKGYLFVSAFLPQFIAPTQPQLAQYVVLAIVFCGPGFPGDVRLCLHGRPGCPSPALWRGALAGSSLWRPDGCGRWIARGLPALRLKEGAVDEVHCRYEERGP
jgi:threonine/homoserine/homoserine lactone efflux protein